MVTTHLVIDHQVVGTSAVTIMRLSSIGTHLPSERVVSEQMIVLVRRDIPAETSIAINTHAVTTHYKPPLSNHSQIDPYLWTILLCAVQQNSTRHSVIIKETVAMLLCLLSTAFQQHISYRV